MKTYLFVYLGSLLVAVLITPIVIKLALRLKLVDLPGARKIHVQPVPRIGGVAIFISAFCLMVPVLLLQNAVGGAFRQVQSKIITLFACSIAIFLLGLVDDIRGLRARTKLSVQVIAAVALCAAGIRVELMSLGGSARFELGVISWPFTMLWVVGITNAVNFSDGLDGLAAGISAIACGVIAILAVISGNIVMAILMLALLGSLTGFLFFNFNPAKIFMGDCGSMFVGFTIASASVLCAVKTGTLVALALPALALGIPIFDTLLSMLRRFLERRSMFCPDRGHFHHRLVDMGLTQRHVAVIAYAVTFIAAGLGMFMIIAEEAATLVVFAAVLLLLFLLFRVVGSVSMRRTVQGLKDQYDIGSRRLEGRRDFEAALLQFDGVQSFLQWWQAMSTAGERMKLAWVSLRFEHEEDWSKLSWRFSAYKENDRVVVTTFTVTPPGLDEPSRCEVAVPVNGSLEAATYRTLLFCRLFEETSFASGVTHHADDCLLQPRINTETAPRY